MRLAQRAPFTFADEKAHFLMDWGDYFLNRRTKKYGLRVALLGRSLVNLRPLIPAPLILRLPFVRSFVYRAGTRADTMRASNRRASHSRARHAAFVRITA